MTKNGTSRFISLEHANKYYCRYGISKQSVLDKIDSKEISIDPLPLKDGETVDADGRIWIYEPPKKEANHSIKTNLRDSRGRLTRYAFACGYVEKGKHTTLSMEHGFYHVRGFLPDMGPKAYVNQVFSSLKKARSAQSVFDKS